MGKILDLYTEYIANWISSGEWIPRNKISSLGINPLFDRILTKKYITKVWCITSLPVKLEENLTQVIRREMFIRVPEVKTYVYKVNSSTKVDTQSQTYKRQLSRAKENYDRYKEFFEQLSEEERLMGKTVRGVNGGKFFVRKEDMDRLEERYESFRYVYTHSSIGGFVRSNYFIIAHAETSQDLRKFSEQIGKVLSERDVYFKELKGNMSKYLSNFGIMSYTDSDTKRQFHDSLFTDENLAGLSSYKTRGLVSGKGILMGVDWLSKLPFSIDFFESPSAQVVLLLARSGHGKTLAAMMTALSFISKGVHCTATDLKGDEWVLLKPYVPGILNIDVSNKFANTLRLDDLEVDSVEDGIEHYESAVRYTTNLFATIVNLRENEGNVRDLEYICNSAINKLYSTNEVIADNPHTFYKTKDLKYEHVLDILEEMRSSKSLEKYSDLIDKLIDRTSVYFRNSTSVSRIMAEEITLRDILDSPLVVYSFNKNRDSMIDTTDVIKNYMTQYLDTKKRYMRKRLGLHTTSYYEEIARAEEVGDLITTISHSVSGSRSSNAIIFLLLNSLSSLKSEKARAIRSNITTYVCGKLEESDIRMLVDEFGQGELEPYLRAISEASDKEFPNCFATNFDTGKTISRTIYKVVIPENMEKELRTRDVEIS